MTTATLTSTAFNVTGMDCASCVAHVDQALRSIDGVIDCQVNLARGRATVQYDASQADAKKLTAAVEGAGYGAEPEAENAGHAAEQDRLTRQNREAAAWRHRAIVGVALWLPLELTHWIRTALGDVHATMPATHDWMTFAALATSTLAILYVGGKFYRSAFSALRRGTTNMDVLIAMGASVAYFYSLILLSGGAMAWWPAPLAGRLFFMEATGLLALISLGHWLEARARQAAGSAIRELLDLTPATAIRLLKSSASRGAPFDARPHPNLLPKGEGTRVTYSGLTILRATGTAPSLPSGGSRSEGERPSALLSENPAAAEFSPLDVTQSETVPVNEVRPGDLLLVRPGDRIPTDGIVHTGESTVDESMLTGESIPAQRSVNDPVIGGTINGDGRLIVRVTQVGAETALAQIVKLVETAQNSKPPVQKLADRVSAVFVPSVLGIALITGIAWFIHGRAVGLDYTAVWAPVANAVCSVLIIACPCALGLAVPAALMVGTGRGAKRGILLRDIDALQKAEQIDTIVLDKTGTVTLGQPRVDSVESLDGLATGELLRLTAGVELNSGHPLAKAIVQHARGQGVVLPEADSFDNQAGLGVIAKIEQRELLVGSERFIRGTGGSPMLADERQATRATDQTAVHIAERRDGVIHRLGVIHLTDTIKPDSAAAIRAMHARGLRVVLLTGDHADVAAAIAKEVGIDEVHAGVLPSGKADVIRALQQQGRRVAMVGDGVNDAPALALANLGIAIGSGSDIAKETGDIVLVSGSLWGVLTSIDLSHATMRVIRQNLFLAFIYNVLAIPLAALGILSPLIAAGAMALSDVSVLGNALRLRRKRIGEISP